MNYREVADAGYPIGSGAVEAANKDVVSYCTSWSVLDLVVNAIGGSGRPGSLPEGPALPLSSGRTR